MATGVPSQQELSSGSRFEAHLWRSHADRQETVPLMLGLHLQPHHTCGVCEDFELRQELHQIWHALIRSAS